VAPHVQPNIVRQRNLRWCKPLGSMPGWRHSLRLRSTIAGGPYVWVEPCRRSPWAERPESAPCCRWRKERRSAGVAPQPPFARGSAFITVARFRPHRSWSAMA